VKGWKDRFSEKPSQYFAPVAPKCMNDRGEIGERRYEINSMRRSRKAVSLARLRKSLLPNLVSKTCSLAWPGRFVD
jgi:hypothetical protein